MSALHEVVVDEVCSMLGTSRHNLDLEASFVALGGHSLSAVQLASRCKKRGAQISVNQILIRQTLRELIESSGTGTAASEVVVEEEQPNSSRERTTSPSLKVRKAAPWKERHGILTPVNGQEHRWQQVSISRPARSLQLWAGADRPASARCPYYRPPTTTGIGSSIFFASSDGSKRAAAIAHPWQH